MRHQDDSDNQPQKLTNTERFTLANQYRILERLCPDEADHYAQCREILENGYTIHYAQLFENVFYELPYAECREVLDILNMYRDLKSRYSRLADQNMGIDPADVTFQGFDGNEETKYMGYAEFLIQTLGRWSEFKDVDLNSHCPMMVNYRAMLQRWRASADPHELTREDIIRIVVHL